MNPIKIEKSKILELVTDLEFQINNNFHELDNYSSHNKLPLYILNKKRKFLSDIQRLTSYTRFLLNSQQQHLPNTDDFHSNFYLSDVLRHSKNYNEKEAARQYSISKSKSDFPELFWKKKHPLFVPQAGVFFVLCSPGNKAANYTTF